MIGKRNKEKESYEETMRNAFQLNTNTKTNTETY